MKDLLSVEGRGPVLLTSCTLDGSSLPDGTVEDNATLANVLNAQGGAAPRGGGGAAAAHTPAYLIKVSAEQDGTFTVTNTRNSFSKTYKPRQ